MIDLFEDFEAFEAEEKWLPVVGYEEAYEVSNHGRVRSIRNDRILKARLDGEGYPLVALYTEGKRKDRTVHSIVLEAFVGPRPQGMFILHYNDVPTDNRLENLRYGTRAENIADAIRNRGTEWNKRLTDEEKIVIVQMRESGMTVNQIARKTKKNPGTIRRVIAASKEKQAA